MSAPLEFQEALATLRFYLANHPQSNVLTGAIRTVLEALEAEDNAAPATSDIVGCTKCGGFYQCYCPSPAEQAE